MKKFFKILIVILLIPIIFVIFLKLYYLIIPGREIGSKGDWISFAGGYIGSIIGLWGIWWQVNNENKEKIRKEVNDGMISDMFRKTRIELAQQGNQAGLLGALYNFLNKNG